MRKNAVLIFLAAWLAVIVSPYAHAEIVRYQFDINMIEVNLAGEKTDALAINNQIPAPTIEATVGDILEVTFHNKMDVETSIHWHGVLLPNNQDGVPHLTTPPIAPHSSFTYRYTITHHGTYWYHSHTGLQEQRGVYGALVFRPQEGERMPADKDYTLILSDWTNESPDQVLANLKKDGDYYALKKQAVQSWDKVISHGSQAIKNKLRHSWMRMEGMDLSDVGYDAFLSNGKQQESLPAQPHDKVRIRLINAAASSYFNVEFAHAPMMVVAADGVDVEPFLVKRLRIAIAETYDVIVPIHENKSYELRATAQDGTGYSSTFIGTGEQILAPTMPKPNLFLMSHHMSHDMSHDMSPDHHMKNMRHTHDSHPKKEVVPYMTDYNHLRALADTSFDKNKPRRDITLNLTGNMERYVWSFNDKTLAAADKIMIKKGEVVRLTLRNQTMMHHPIHLHGHFFRVLTAQGARSPLKHTVNVPPLQTVIIEFDANTDKDWFFHCHNLYHMKTGMARVISYERTSKATDEILAKLGPDRWYMKGDVAALSNMSMGLLQSSNTNNFLEIEYEYNYEKEYEAELIYARNLIGFLDIYAGGDFEREDEHNSSEQRGIIGIRYILPFLLESNLRIDSEGRVRFALTSDVQLTERLRFGWSYNTDNEYDFSLGYEIDKALLLTATYDSDFRWGGGLRLRF